MTTIEPNEPAIKCSHPKMPEPIKSRLWFKACEDCGWVLDSWNGTWVRTRLRVSLPVTEEAVFKGILQCAFTTKPMTATQIDRTAKHEKRLASIAAKKAYG